MYQTKPILGRWIVSLVLLLLMSFETFTLYWVCHYRGFMMVQEFCFVAVLLSALHLILVLPVAKLLPTRIWQVPVLTVALLLPGWHNTNPGRLNYWTAMERLHNGMTVAQTRAAVAPYPLARGQFYFDPATPEKVAEAQRTVGPDFTGKLVCRPLNPSGNDANEDGVTITFEHGYVTAVFTWEGD